MATKEIEVKLNNIEMQMLNLAERQVNRGNENEAKINNNAYTMKGAVENAEQELAESMLALVEVINVLNETMEEVSENE